MFAQGFRQPTGIDLQKIETIICTLPTREMKQIFRNNEAWNCPFDYTSGDPLMREIFIIYAQQLAR